MNNNNNDFPDVRNDGQGERSYMNLQNLNGFMFIIQTQTEYLMDLSTAI